MHKNRNYDPVGLLLAEEGLFGLPLPEVGSTASRWPKSARLGRRALSGFPLAEKCQGHKT